MSDLLMELRMAIAEYLLGCARHIAPSRHPDTVALNIQLLGYFRAVNKRLAEGRRCHEYAENTTKVSR